MFSKKELDILMDALLVRFWALEKVVGLATDKAYEERKKEERNELLTLLLKVINLSDLAE